MNEQVELKRYMWRLLSYISDFEEKALPPGTGPGTANKAIALGYLELNIRKGRKYWKRTPLGEAAWLSNAERGRLPPAPWGLAGRLREEKLRALA